MKCCTEGLQGVHDILYVQGQCGIGPFCVGGVALRVDSSSKHAETIRMGGC